MVRRKGDGAFEDIQSKLKYSATIQYLLLFDSTHAFPSWISHILQANKPNGNNHYRQTFVFQITKEMLYYTCSHVNILYEKDMILCYDCFFNCIISQEQLTYASSNKTQNHSLGRCITLQCYFFNFPVLCFAHSAQCQLATSFIYIYIYIN